MWPTEQGLIMNDPLIGFTSGTSLRWPPLSVGKRDETDPFLLLSRDLGLMQSCTNFGRSRKATEPTCTGNINGKEADPPCRYFASSFSLKLIDLLVSMLLGDVPKAGWLAAGHTAWEGDRMRCWEDELLKALTRLRVCINIGRCGRLLIAGMPYSSFLDVMTESFWQRQCGFLFSSLRFMPLPHSVHVRDQVQFILTRPKRRERRNKWDGELEH